MYSEQVLHLWLETLCSCVEVVEKWYQPWSFMRSPGWVQIKCELRLVSHCFSACSTTLFTSPSVVVSKVLLATYVCCVFVCMFLLIRLQEFKRLHLSSWNFHQRSQVIPVDFVLNFTKIKSPEQKIKSKSNVRVKSVHAWALFVRWQHPAMCWYFIVAHVSIAKNMQILQHTM